MNGEYTRLVEETLAEEDTLDKMKARRRANEPKEWVSSTGAKVERGDKVSITGQKPPSRASGDGADYKGTFYVRKIFTDGRRVALVRSKKDVDGNTLNVFTLDNKNNTLHSEGKNLRRLAVDVVVTKEK